MSKPYDHVRAQLFRLALKNRKEYVQSVNGDYCGITYGEGFWSETPKFIDKFIHNMRVRQRHRAVKERDGWLIMEHTKEKA